MRDLKVVMDEAREKVRSASTPVLLVAVFVMVLLALKDTTINVVKAAVALLAALGFLTCALVVIMLLPVSVPMLAIGLRKYCNYLDLLDKQVMERVRKMVWGQP